MSKRAIITGVTGQDGSCLAELLVSKGYDAVGLVRRSSAPNALRGYSSSSIVRLSGRVVAAAPVAP